MAINPILRGWRTTSGTPRSKTLHYLGHYTWWRVMRWLRAKHPKANWTWFRRGYFGTDGLTEADVTLFRPDSIPVTSSGRRTRPSSTTGTFSSPGTPAARAVTGARPLATIGAAGAVLTEVGISDPLELEETLLYASVDPLEEAKLRAWLDTVRQPLAALARDRAGATS
jgi:hypothetical protein